MADKWKSNERHFCKACNVWMQGDKMSIKHHEQGRKHKECVQEGIKAKQKAKSEAFHADRELQKQLKAIDDAANAKFAMDIAGGRNPPPPPPRHHTKPAPPPPRTYVVEDEQPIDDLPNKPSGLGVYEIRGSVYLEGKRHEDKLRTGEVCEIWVETAEAWCNGLIENTSVHGIPNTELSFKRFTVTYQLPNDTELQDSSATKQVVTENNILSDRLRIKLPSEMTLESAEQWVKQIEGQTNEETEYVHSNREIDESTGIGEWSTVQVREIDEVAEATAREVERVKQEKEKINQQEMEVKILALETTEDAMGAYNPYSGHYKGITLDHDDTSNTVKQHKEAVQNESIQLQMRVTDPVSFKKKSRNKNEKDPNKSKKQKRMRKEEIE